MVLVPLCREMVGSYQEVRRTVAKNLLRLTEKLEMQPENLEDLMNIYSHIGEELRILHRRELGDKFFQINDCLVDEINLREAKTAVGWRKAVMDRKDRIMSSMEDCLRYVVGNLRESNKLFPVKDGGNPYTTTSTIGEYRHLRACMYVSFDRPLGGNEEGRRERREGGRERREGGKEEVLTIMMMAVILTVLQIVIRLTGRIDDGADDGAVREYGGSPHSG
eukprot:GHVU01167361.1.p1 GENE.GHVU01167361.1~~GHVU01167361.1.p1  ORF type:complete len:221 (+),score=32.93 GHVU01167361.1:1108-1770(+)